MRRARSTAPVAPHVRAGRSAAAACLLLAGCAVGPNYRGPPDVAPRSEAVPAFVRAGAAPVSNAAPPLAAWWKALGDPVLDDLEDRALRASPTLASAAARVRSARATLRQDETQLLPSGGATSYALRARLPGGSSVSVPGVAGPPAGGAPSASSDGQQTKLFSAGANATWELDIFGGTRRQIESARDSMEADVADFQDMQVMLTSDVATAYLNVRDNRNRLLIGEKRVVALRRILELQLQRRVGGTADDSNVADARNQLAQAEANNAPLRANVQVYADQLAAYLGQEPGTVDVAFAEDKPPPVPPDETAVGDPAALIRRRPDIRNAERTLASKNATIGANVAQYFPQVQLVGLISFSGPKAGGLVKKKNMTWVVGPTLSWNFLDIPATRAKVAQAQADFEEAAATYRSTVLNALRDVENGLSQYGGQRVGVGSYADAADASALKVDVVRRRYEFGTASLIDVLNARQQALQDEQTLAQNTATLTSNWVSLQSKLGLGWGVPGTPDAFSAAWRSPENLGRLPEADAPRSADAAGSDVGWPAAVPADAPRPAAGN